MSGQRQRVPLAALHHHLTQLGARHTRIRAGRPQTNGHVENLHKTILDECLILTRLCTQPLPQLHRASPRPQRIPHLLQHRPRTHRPPHQRQNPPRHHRPSPKDETNTMTNRRHIPETAQSNQRQTPTLHSRSPLAARASMRPRLSAHSVLVSRRPKSLAIVDRFKGACLRRQVWASFADHRRLHHLARHHVREIHPTSLPDCSAVLALTLGVQAAASEFLQSL
jgi:hypothetical protein